MIWIKWITTYFIFFIHEVGLSYGYRRFNIAHTSYGPLSYFYCAILSILELFGMTQGWIKHDRIFAIVQLCNC